MRVIAVMNQKGGVGKTTTTANLGAALAEAGKRVCLIDMDPQSHLTINYGVEPTAVEKSLYTMLVEELFCPFCCKINAWKSRLPSLKLTSMPHQKVAIRLKRSDARMVAFPSFLQMVRLTVEEPRSSLPLLSAR